MIEIQAIQEVINHVDGLKAVIFDLDDTLYSEKEYVKSGYKAIGSILPEVLGAEEKLWKAFEEKKKAVDVVLKEEGIYTEELKKKCLHVYRNHKPEIHLYDEALKLLKELRNRQLRLGLITDGRPEGQRAKIEVLNLEEFMDFIIVTDELGDIEYRKPCEKAFCLMRDNLGIAYEEMCYVGDNIRKDFIAPEKLGMKAIWFRNKEGLYE